MRRASLYLATIFLISGAVELAAAKSKMTQQQMFTRQRPVLTYHRMGPSQVSHRTIRKAHNFAKGYMRFLDAARTAEWRTDRLIENARSAGAIPLESLKEWKPGTKVYWTNQNRSIFIAVLGEEGPERGMNIIGTHIDSPHADPVPRFITEDKKAGVAAGTLQAYGGFHPEDMMVATPLGIFGSVYRKDGTREKIGIGNKRGDPVFIIPQLLPHLDKKIKADRPANQTVLPDEMKVYLGGYPVRNKQIANPIKEKVLRYLWARHKITEEDLLSSKLELVPLTRANWVGFDKSMIVGYGQDDLVNTYSSAKALLRMKTVPKRTAILAAFDKEETGSEGITGAKGPGLDKFVGDLMALSNPNFTDHQMRNAYFKSFALSADVNELISPNYPSVFDGINNPKAHHGPSLTPYTGHGGKYDTNDADPRYLALLRSVFAKHGVMFQMGTLGKPGQGGGGTIAKYMADKGINTVDYGASTMGMHTRAETTSVLDNYMTFRGAQAFYTLTGDAL